MSRLRGDMNKTHAKYQKASAKMCSSLFDIMKQKEFSEISIKEICEAAHVNRSTFYAHYDNTRDLLNEMRQGLVDEFFRKYKGVIDELKTKGFKDEMVLSNEAFLMPYLNFFKITA